MAKEKQPSWLLRAKDPKTPTLKINGQDATVRTRSSYSKELGGEILYPTIRINLDGNLVQLSNEDAYQAALIKKDYILIKGPPGKETQDKATKKSIEISNSMKKARSKKMNEGGLLDEGGTIDPVSGNDVPVGSLDQEVRDDIPAMLSEGEFVFPADVVRYIGLEKLMKIRQTAKEGLAEMEDMGQMSNSEEATKPDDVDMDVDVDAMIDELLPEEREFNVGGYVAPQQAASSQFMAQPSYSQPNKPISRAYQQPKAPVTYPLPGTTNLYGNTSPAGSPAPLSKKQELFTDGTNYVMLTTMDGVPVDPIPAGYYRAPEGTPIPDSLKPKGSKPTTPSAPKQQTQDDDDFVPSKYDNESAYDADKAYLDYLDMIKTYSEFDPEFKKDFDKSDISTYNQKTGKTEGRSIEQNIKSVAPRIIASAVGGPLASLAFRNDQDKLGSEAREKINKLIKDAENKDNIFHKVWKKEIKPVVENKFNFFGDVAITDENRQLFMKSVNETNEAKRKAETEEIKKGSDSDDPITKPTGIPDVRVREDTDRGDTGGRGQSIVSVEGRDVGSFSTKDFGTGRDWSYASPFFNKGGFVERKIKSKPKTIRKRKGGLASKRR